MDLNNTTNECQFACESFIAFDSVYAGYVHRPLTFAICAIGTLANALNIIVLTRKEMSSPTNVLLTGLSIAQLGLVVNNLLLTSFDTLRDNCTPGLRSYSWSIFKIINVNLSVVCHSIALSHTVTLAIFRYIAVRIPTKARVWVTCKTAKYTVAFIYVIIPIICVPTYFSAIVVELDEEEKLKDPCTELLNETVFDLDFSNETLLSFTLFAYGATLKLLPCVIITLLSYGLVKSLQRVAAKRATMKHSEEQKSYSRENTNKTASERNQRNRITTMLLVIVLLFVAVEFPQGLMALLCGILGKQFAYEVYNNVADLFSMLTLLYSSINFILYCVMSTQFQSVFKKLFCTKFNIQAKSAQFDRFVLLPRFTGGGVVTRMNRSSAHSSDKNYMAVCPLPEVVCI